MSVVTVLSQKEKIFYDRREWCTGTIIGSFILGLLMVLAFMFLEYERPGSAVWTHTWVFVLVAVAASFLFSMDRGSMHIVVTDSKLIFHLGYFLMRRTIHYNEIFSIAFKSANSTNLNRHYGRKRFYIGRAKPEIIIYLRDGDHFIVGGSKYAEEILSAIKLVRPHINID